MDNNPKFNHRRSIRLREYDSSQPGAYFITIVSYQRKNLFGHIIDGEMILNQAGEIVEKTWRDISKNFHNARCDIYVIMPNHLQGIIEIIENGPVGATPVFVPRHLVSRPYPKGGLDLNLNQLV
ncbi:MAG: hypothetical protein ACK2TV_12965 [Anaerolineales bacterium]